MTISDFFAELKNRNRLLYYFGWTNVVLFFVCFLLYFIDPNMVTGINKWIKPMKFALSVVVYVWTFAWLLHYLHRSTIKAVISWGIMVCMIVENTLITYQAARGVPSHFNIQTGFDALIFGVMGMFISINSLLIALVIILFFTKAVSIHGPQLIAWRAGLILFFLGGISGGLMSAHLAHTYGGTDGGAGLPFTNWSTTAGDMRIAHFVTLHGLQVIPLFVWIIASRTSKPTLVTFTFLCLYALLAIGLHILALHGRPLLSI